MIPRFVNIKDSTTLVRDTFSMGILSTNTSEYESAKNRHQVALQKIAEERRREHELNTLHKEVNELKQIMKQILEREK